MNKKNTSLPATAINKGQILTLIGSLFSSTSLVIVVIFLGLFLFLGVTIFQLAKGLPGELVEAPLAHLFEKNGTSQTDQIANSAVNRCSAQILSQAAVYKGIPYSLASHCGPLTTTGRTGVKALDCSGYVSRVLWDLGLTPKGHCMRTASILAGDNYLVEVSPENIQPGDLVVSAPPNQARHVVIYVEGDIKSRFVVWESGGGDPGGNAVRKTTRRARPNQRYFRPKACL